MLLNAYREDRAQHYDPVQFSMLPSLLCVFAESVGDYERALYWAQFGIDDARKRGNPAGVAALAMALVPHLIREGRFVEALDAARESSTAYSASAILRTRGAHAFTVGQDAATLIATADSKEKLDVEEMALQFGGMPVAFALATIASEKKSDASEAAARVVAFTDELAKEQPASGWQHYSSAVRAVFISESSLDELTLLAKAANKEQATVAWAVLTLGLSINSSAAATPELAVSAHLNILPHVSKMLSTNSAFRFTVSDFILKYWLHVSASQSFRFRAPASLRDELQRIASSGNMHPREVLKAVIQNSECRSPRKPSHTRSGWTETNNLHEFDRVSDCLLKPA